MFKFFPQPNSNWLEPEVILAVNEYIPKVMYLNAVLCGLFN